MNRLTTAAILVVLTGVAALAQQVRPLPQAQLYGELRKLQSFTSVLYVAAHPDDENTRLLSWLARGQHIRTAYVSLTRGDGGQNILGSEQGAALGLIRTNELLEARGLDGAEQFFTRAIDFGFSKNAEETFQHWDADVLTQDVIRVIERFRPDVMICRFPASRMAGHGQHEASAIIAKRAYEACPPEQRPTRLLFNAFRFGDRSTIKEGMFALDVGQFDPLIGMGYGELAGLSRSLHKSQGAGTPSTPGVQREYFETLAGQPPSISLFDGIDTTWNRVGRADIGLAIDAVLGRFWQGAPHELLPELFRIRAMITEIKDPFWRDLKLQQITSVIVSALGITADASVAQPLAVAGSDVKTTLRVVARAGRQVQLAGIRWPDGEESTVVQLGHDSLYSVDRTVRIPQTVKPTNPYWLERDAAGGLFTIDDASLLGEPMTPPQLTVGITLRVYGESISLSLPLSYKQLDPLHGDVIEELRIVPPVSVEPVSPLAVRGPQGLSIGIRLRAFVPIQSARLMLFSNSGMHTVASGIQMRANTDTLITIQPPVSTSEEVSFTLEVQGASYSSAVKVIDYDHLPVLQYLEPARVRVVAEPITITAKRVAFVPGAGEITPDVLRTLGVVVDEVSDEQILRTDDLLQYDAVLVGIRAVNTRESLQFLMPALMTYVERGGTLVMQYNTSRGLASEDLGPYPFRLTRDRVTEEDADVTILKPTSPLLTKPNPITTADFDGWVQERGLYFTGDSDARYERVLSMHDAGEEPLDGSLLYTTYGKGHYVYCALSLFRQLPGGVPGGMKLLANMLSLGR